MPMHKPRRNLPFARVPPEPWYERAGVRPRTYTRWLYVVLRQDLQTDVQIFDYARRKVEHGYCAITERRQIVQPWRAPILEIQVTAQASDDESVEMQVSKEAYRFMFDELNKAWSRQYDR